MGASSRRSSRGSRRLGRPAWPTPAPRNGRLPAMRLDPASRRRPLAEHRSRCGIGGACRRLVRGSHGGGFSQCLNRSACMPLMMTAGDARRGALRRGRSCCLAPGAEPGAPLSPEAFSHLGVSAPGSPKEMPTRGHSCVMALTVRGALCRSMCPLRLTRMAIGGSAASSGPAAFSPLAGCVRDCGLET
jgi:hypothetical protein